MKLTLDDAWKHCLAQWEFVAKEVQKPIDKGKWPKDWGGRADVVCGLKRGFLYNDRFCNRFCGDILNDCFFCEYTQQFNSNDPCSYCPAKLIDSEFSCYNPAYDYIDKPIEFYAEIKRLYQIYQESKAAL